MLDSDGWEYASAYHYGLASTVSGFPIMFAPSGDGVGYVRLRRLDECERSVTRALLDPYANTRSAAVTAFAVGVHDHMLGESD